MRTSVRWQNRKTQTSFSHTQTSFPHVDTNSTTQTNSFHEKSRHQLRIPSPKKVASNLIGKIHGTRRPESSPLVQCSTVQHNWEETPNSQLPLGLEKEHWNIHWTFRSYWSGMGEPTRRTHFCLAWL